MVNFQFFIQLFLILKENPRKITKKCMEISYWLNRFCLELIDRKHRINLKILPSTHINTLTGTLISVYWPPGPRHFFSTFNNYFYQFLVINLSSDNYTCSFTCQNIPRARNLWITYVLLLRDYFIPQKNWWKLLQTNMLPVKHRINMKKYEKSK